MSTVYCYKHDSLNDTDFHTCRECEAELVEAIEALEKRIEQLRFDQYVRSCSNPRFETSGEANVFRMTMSQLQDDLAKLHEQLKECIS